MSDDVKKPTGEGWTEGACPFCLATMHVNFDLGELLHALPMCEKFKTLSADEFVRAVLAGEHLT